MSDLTNSLDMTQASIDNVAAQLAAALIARGMVVIGPGNPSPETSATDLFLRIKGNIAAAIASAAPTPAMGEGTM